MISGFSDVIAIAGTILPVYVINLFKGQVFWPGIFQLIFLVGAGVLQWKFTTGSWLSLRLIGAVVTYLAANSIFTTVMMLWPFLEIPYRLLAFTVLLPLVFVLALVFAARATRPRLDKSPAR